MHNWIVICNQMTKYFFRAIKIKMGITNKKEISMVTSTYVVVVSTRPAKHEYRTHCNNSRSLIRPAL